MSTLPRPTKALITLTHTIDQVIILNTFTGQKHTLDITTLSLTQVHACLMQLANLLTDNLLHHGADSRLNALIRFEEDFYTKE